ncbi:MAG: hypothetical protein Ct9H300mP4_04810 [Gammaproteobacteria bacterium]|nr:MAG: hypothetical protein Ct9H300mP4_04810 [Gammaproteobacteria bacterium]
MRGSHPGSFEVAHALARNGHVWAEPTDQTDRVMILCVGGDFRSIRGISL